MLACCAKRWIRASIGADLWQRVQIRRRVLVLGNVGARWCVQPDAIERDAIVYSFGVGEDVSFDLELIRRFQVKVNGFDPTPRSGQWVAQQELPREFAFYPYGVASFDGLTRFSPPADPAHVSHTLLNRTTPWPTIELPVHRLQTIMKRLSHHSISLLKMDIEGAEYAVLQDMLLSRIYPAQILVEFHHRWKEIGLCKTREAIRELCRHGYRIFDISASGEEYGFLYSADLNHAGGDENR